jgi:glycosyltransferase involved in cell wall biosynthesis
VSIHPQRTALSPASTPSDPGPSPDLSLVMPCYNEDQVVGYTIPRLLGAFEKAGYLLELIAVDNGSSDRTGEIIQALATQHRSIVTARIDRNEGYGHGVLSGIPLSTAPWVGIIPADGQVDAEDVVRLYEAVVVTNGQVLGKVRRRFRMDGLRRKIVSVLYNLLVRALWPTLRSLDVNGLPKILPRDVLAAMELRSKGWVLDLEIMIKAHHARLRVLEVNVFARMRGSGVSHVRLDTVWEFLRKLLAFRLSPGWRRDLKRMSSTDLARPPLRRPS